jgi:hypothetical protein
MHMMKILALTALLATTAGCATSNRPTTSIDTEADVLKEIAQSVQRATDAQVRLAAMKGANRGLLIGESSTGEGLDAPISISWSGPIDKLAQKIAELSGFEYGGIVGKRPTVGVNVVINATNEKGRIILLNANAQAGSAARVELSEGSKKIVVRYAPTPGNGGFPVMK